MQLTKQELKDRLLEVFAARGFEGATIAEIARAVSLGKASLYHHFPGGKREMVDVIVHDACENLSLAVLAPLRDPDEPERRVSRMIDGIRRYNQDGERNCLLAVLALGSVGAEFADPISRQVEQWMELLGQTLVDAGISRKTARRRARDAVSRVHGAIVVSRMMRDTKSFRQMLKRLPEQLLEPET